MIYPITYLVPYMQYTQ